MTFSEVWSQCNSERSLAQAQKEKKPNLNLETECNLYGKKKRESMDVNIMSFKQSREEGLGKGMSRPQSASRSVGKFGGNQQIKKVERIHGF